MKKILNVIFVLIITLLTACNSKYAYAELEVITHKKDMRMLRQSLMCLIFRILKKQK